MPQDIRLVLGSSSRYRKKLLEQLGLPFQTDSPDIDESPVPGEPPENLVRRLSREKAMAVSERHPDALIIGCDQVATFGSRIIGKPGSYENARNQLQLLSGKRITLHSGLALFNSATNKLQLTVVPYDVQFRNLNDGIIEQYLVREKPWDCTGSVRVEGPGIALFEKLEGEDPNALIGLPLIRLVTMLEIEGVTVFAGSGP